MARKAPRRTAERILEAALDLFNRFGEPNVSTTVVAAQLGISPGNLYYHYPAKEGIVNALSQRYAQRLNGLLQEADAARDVPAAWSLLQSLFACLWDYRFLYRDINDLLSRNLTLETQFRQILAEKHEAARRLLQALRASGALAIDTGEIEATATSMVMVLTYWLSFEFVRDPRHAQDTEEAQHALVRGAQQVMHLLSPYLERTQG